MKESKNMMELIKLRHALHKHPEISGEESETAKRITNFLHQFHPDQLYNNIGGYGLIAEFKGKEPGPTVMFRCELDALPIQEKSKIKYSSTFHGKAHLCGHDGHMAMVAGLGYHLKLARPRKGRVILLFQPNEETGKGAYNIITDPVFKKIEPDYIFAIHNVPGYPLHQILLSDKHFAAASSGMAIKLKGKSSHAAEPENGINPGQGIAKIMLSINDLLSDINRFNDFILITPVHFRLGNLAYGTSPGEGIVHLTLRSYRNDDMHSLKKELETLVKRIAGKEKLTLNIAYEEVFPATINNPLCAQIVKDSCANGNLNNTLINNPFKWSEDFGHFTEKYPGALIGLGSGVSQPALHNPDFDFPDELIQTGVGLFKRIYESILNHD